MQNELKPAIGEIQNRVYTEYAEKYRAACGAHAWEEARKIADKFYEVFPQTLADHLLKELRISGECAAQLKWYDNRRVDYEPCRNHFRDDFTPRL